MFSFYVLLALCEVLRYIILKVRIQVYEYNTTGVGALDPVSLRHYGVVSTVYLVHTAQESSLRLS